MLIITCDCCEEVQTEEEEEEEKEEEDDDDDDDEKHRGQGGRGVKHWGTRARRSWHA